MRVYACIYTAVLYTRVICMYLKASSFALVRALDACISHVHTRTHLHTYTRGASTLPHSTNASRCTCNASRRARRGEDLSSQRRRVISAYVTYVCVTRCACAHAYRRARFSLFSAFSSMLVDYWLRTISRIEKLYFEICFCRLL